jgi:hypothetical protein
MILLNEEVWPEITHVFTRDGRSLNRVEGNPGCILTRKLKFLPPSPDKQISLHLYLYAQYTNSQHRKNQFVYKAQSLYRNTIEN